MKSLLIIFAVSLLACTTSDKENKYSVTPKWTEQLKIVNNTLEATIKKRHVISFDSTIFKFIDKNKNFMQAPEERERQYPDGALNVFINNGAEKKVKITPPSLSRIENIYNNLVGLSGGKAISQVGYKELQNNNPDDDSPVSKDYIIGPGDKIKVELTGSINQSEIYTVNDKGLIFIKDGIGPVQLYGVNKSEVQDLINQVIKKEYRNYKLSSELVDLRNIRLLLSGKITNPGLKSLRPGSTLIDALSKAGGILKNGSLREVTVKSKNGEVRKLDLYQLFFQGDQKTDIPLRSGDQIIIPPIGDTVCIMGITGRGIYETKGETLKELFKIHGRLNAFTSSERVFLEYSVHQEERQTLSLNLTEALPVKLKDGYIFEFQSVRDTINNTVEINGPVTRPGKYPWRQGMKVSELVKKGEGFLLNASIHKALIKRKLAGEIIYKNAGNTGVVRVREELIWLPLDELLSGDKTKDIELKRFDTLQIMTVNDFQDTPTVEIIGAIRKQGKYKLTQNMTLGDLVLLAGNPAKNAYPGQGVIVRKVYNQQAENFDVKMYHFNVLDIVNNGRSSLVTLEEGDRVIIRIAASKSVKVNISGQVQFPGSYILPAGSKIADLIKSAGGLLRESDLRAADFQRDSIKQLQLKRLDQLFEKTRQRFSRSRSYITRDGKLGESYASTMELRSLNKLRNEMMQSQIKGRVVLDFTQDNFPNTEDNLVLEEMDQLIIPKKLNSVMVMGHVYSPNAFVWREKLSVEEYLKKSGGYKEEAGSEEVYLVLASGEVHSAKQIGHSKLMRFFPGPGDSILVPKKELERSGMAIASDYLSFLRKAAEVGAIANSIPNAGESQISINSDTTTREVQAGSYEALIK